MLKAPTLPKPSAVQSSSRYSRDNTRACKQAESRVYILSHVDVPAVFAECGFLSNPEEAEKLCDENYQKKLAAAIADGIIAFCKAE